MRNKMWFIIGGLLICLALGVILSPFASPAPDGLEKVAFEKGFLETEKKEPLASSPFPDYLFPGLDDGRLATAFAGLVGVLGTFFIVYGLAFSLKKKTKKIPKNKIN